MNEIIDLNPNEATYYTNRAFSLIYLKEFKQAIDCCEQALRVNPNLGRAHKRLFKCYLSLGDFDKAKQELQLAQELDPSDATNKTDANALENVLTQERVVVRHVEKSDYETALTYIEQILAECPGSERHTLKKLEFMARTAKLTEAQTFSSQVCQWSCFRQSGPLQAMRGRIIFYNGNEVLAKKQLMQALEIDPDN